MVGVESHRSNERVERVIATIKKGLMKSKDKSLEENVLRIVEGYNETYNSGIKCRPKEAWEDKLGIVMI